MKLLQMVLQELHLNQGHLVDLLLVVKLKQRDILDYKHILQNQEFMLLMISSNWWKIIPGVNVGIGEVRYDESYTSEHILLLLQELLLTNFIRWWRRWWWFRRKWCTGGNTNISLFVDDVCRQFHYRWIWRKIWKLRRCRWKWRICKYSCCHYE